MVLNYILNVENHDALRTTAFEFKFLFVVVIVEHKLELSVNDGIFPKVWLLRFFVLSTNNKAVNFSFDMTSGQNQNSFTCAVKIPFTISHSLSLSPAHTYKHTLTSKKNFAACCLTIVSVLQHLQSMYLDREKFTFCPEIFSSSSPLNLFYLKFGI